MKAIRLVITSPACFFEFFTWFAHFICHLITQVANKLFPMASISKKIEDFANEKLNSVLEVIPPGDSATTEMATPEAHKVCLMLSRLSDVLVLIFFSDWVYLHFL